MDFHRGPKVEDSGRSNGTAIEHSYSGDVLRAYSRRMIEPRGMKDKGRSLTSHAEAYSPLYWRLYIPVFQIRMEKMKEVKRPPL
ncbi:hypothetical protein GW17_00058593 [Ensete ventricosum]|nr:hypothetical protein GW17_00058593 [Ensete ventricosum]